jgi:hypothetical protein
MAPPSKGPRKALTVRVPHAVAAALAEKARAIGAGFSAGTLLAELAAEICQDHRRCECFASLVERRIKTTKSARDDLDDEMDRLERAVPRAPTQAASVPSQPARKRGVRPDLPMDKLFVPPGQPSMPSPKPDGQEPNRASSAPIDAGSRPPRKARRPARRQGRSRSR